MKIRHTTEQDFDRVMAIYAHARAFMAAHGNPNQWGPTHWPPEALIHADIAAGSSYVCEQDGRVIGTFCFIQGKEIEPTYAHIADGRWRDDSPYGVCTALQPTAPCAAPARSALIGPMPSAAICASIPTGIIP